MRRFIVAAATFVAGMIPGAASADPDMSTDVMEWRDAEGNVYQCMAWNGDGCLYASIPVNGGVMEHYVNRQGIRTSRYVPDRSTETDPPEGWHF